MLFVRYFCPRLFLFDDCIVPVSKRWVIRCLHGFVPGRFTSFFRIIFTPMKFNGDSSFYSLRRATPHIDRKHDCLNSRRFLFLSYSNLRLLLLISPNIYYNLSRPHQGIEQHIPKRFGEPCPSLSNRPKGRIVSIPILQRLHHNYAYSSAIH